MTASRARDAGADAFTHAPWTRALGLDERPAPVRAIEATPWARERLERWRSRFRDDSRFAERLARAGHDEAGLLALLAGASGEAAESDEGSERPPRWWRELVETYERAGAKRLAAGREHDLGQGCLRLVRPLLRPALERLAGRAASLRGGGLLSEPRRTAEALLEPLVRELVELVARTVVLELNVARLTADDSQLSGEGAARFLERLARPTGAVDLLAEYPVLARLLHTRTHLCVSAACELLDRLSADAAELEAAGLAGPPPFALTGAQRLGDWHDGGRAVIGLSFGDGRAVVYKPRPLEMEAAYARLLGELAAAGLVPAPSAPRTLAREGYGWQERLERHPCRDDSAVGRFYARLGAQLAIVYALRGVDIHRDNVFAVGEHPMLVDLETLLHPRVGGAEAARVEPLTASGSADSVTRVWLLPSPDPGLGMDYSGIGREADQEVDQLRLEGEETDSPHLVLRRGPAPAGHHRPSGPRADPWLRVDEMCGGFAAAYRVLYGRRRELLRPGGPARSLEAAEARVVLRPTSVYARLLAEAARPDHLRDALDRDRLLDGLWLAARSRPDLPPVVDAELSDLRAGDVPRFTHRAGARAVHHHYAGQIADVIGPGCATDPAACLSRLEEADRERQLAFVRTALAATDPDARWPTHVLEPAPGPGRDLIACSKRLARRLGVLALRDGPTAGWLSPTAVDDGRLVLLGVGLDLAEGLAGISLYLSWHAELTGDQPALALARAAAEPIREACEAGELDTTGPGLLEGAGGPLLALVRLGHLCGDRSLLAVARRLCRTQVERLEEATDATLARGAAGLGPGLLALRGVVDGDELGPLAERCAELVADARPATDGGLALGDAGVACGLFDLAAAGGAGAARDAALAAADRIVRAGEPASGCPAPEPHGGPPPDSWLAGAAGRSLALARAVAESPTPARRDGLRCALERTAREAFGYDHSLGHGDTGAVEALLLGARALGDRPLADHALRLAAALSASVGARPLCGRPGGLETPGLASGLAGIGLGMLRFAAPDRVAAPPGSAWASSGGGSG